MHQYIVAFLTGLTTGGLSCLAVQGGLLASSLANQIEKDVIDAGNRRGKRRLHPRTALPILFFLSAKLTAYTILGFLLGLVGSVLTLNATLRAILLVGIGIFMIGNALRMLNVHPFFRYFAIEPPKFITRYIRRTAKNGTDWFTPLFLGVLTVLIPCGVTQAMMAVALTTGNPLQGAALMFAFILGTSPVFFLVAYLTTQLGTRLEKWFMRFVSVVLLLLGFISINSGLNLTGRPLFLFPADSPGQNAYITPLVTTPDEKVLILHARNDGYLPRRLDAPANIDLTLNVVTDKTFSCSRAFMIPAIGVEVILPETGVVPISISAQEDGTVLSFTCSMGMYTGEIVFGDGNG